MSSYKLSTISRAVIRYTTQNNLVKKRQTAIIRYYVTSKASRPPQSAFQLILKGLGIGVLAGTAYAGYCLITESKQKAHFTYEKEKLYFLNQYPDVKITRKIVNEKDDSGLDITLFQYQTCPFCCKVRAFLDYYGLSYKIVEVDAVLRQSIRWSPTKKVPTMLIKTKDNRYLQLNDSSMIISTLASFLRDKDQDIAELASYYPKITFKDDNGVMKADIMNKYFLMFKDNDLPKNINRETLDEERKWRSWADEHLVHLISPNVYRNKSEALETFEWFSDVGEWSEIFPKWERNLMVYVGAAAMWGISKRLKKRHDLTDDVRSHLYDACDKWMKQLEKKNSAFLGGKNPNLADLAVFGVLNSMEGCQAFKDCLQNTNIGSWFYAVKEYIIRNKGHVA